MAALEQSEIDKLLAQTEEALKRQSLAKSAKEKINACYKKVVGYINIEEMNDLKSIGTVIKEIGAFISSDDEHYHSFMNLKLSYELKTRK